MDPMTIAALISGGFGLFSSLFNANSQKQTNQSNLDYAKAMTEKQWERDDTSYQRAVADATAAGFSPLAVLDGGLSPNGSPVGYSGIAPTFDVNALLNSLATYSNQKLTQSENEKNRTHENEKIQKEFKNEVNILNQTYEKLETQEQRNFVRSLDLLSQTNKMNYESDKYKETIREAEQLGAVQLVVSSDYNEVLKQNNITMSNYDSWMANYKNVTTSSGDTETVNASAGTGKLPGVNVNAGATVTSNTTTQSITYEQHAEKFWSNNVWYVYKPDYKYNTSKKTGN